MNHGDSRSHLAFGTYAEGLRWVGRSTPVRPCSDPVNHAQVKAYAALVRDGNPSYWDEQWASDTWGDVLSPPGMLMVWSWPLAWVPDHVATYPPMLAPLVPLPGDRVVNASSRTCFGPLIRVGDRLTVEETVKAVSPERRTALGPGHFITTEATYRLPDGTPVATHVNTMLRYTVDSTGEGSAHRTPAPAPEDTPAVVADPRRPRVGGLIPGIKLDVTLETCVQCVAATRDFLPAHYDADYARASGAPQPFINTMFIHGFIDRAGTDWAGPLSRVVRREVRFHSPAFAGAELHASGRVVEVEAGGSSDVVVGLEIVVRSGDRLAASARCDLQIGAAARYPDSNER
ncbi:FAS1-like dehydratase domain-containing protein [Prauserella endophytica]|nr:MaoC family dehydratase N-terminal domain-containing protein [Prauserella endophytica]